MRILVTTGPLFGHVNTVLPMALAAKRAGHDVVIATGPDMVGYVARRGVPTWTVGPTYLEAGGAPTSPLSFLDSGAKRAVDLVPIALDWLPDVVIHEETELAGPVVAARTGARHVVHGLSVMPSADTWARFAGPLRTLGETWGVADLDGAVRAARYVDVCPPALRPSGQRVWRRAQARRPMLVEPAGADRLPAGFADLPYPRTVHLTLGTVFNTALDVLRAALEALREFPVNVVVTVGPQIDPTVLGPQPRHVLVERMVPHALLLPHCLLVASQAGSGVLFGGLSHGLPQLLLPQGADQFQAAEACESAGAGIALRPGEVGAGAVASAVQRLLTEPGFTAAAAAIRNEIERMPSADEAFHAVTCEESRT